LRGVVIHVEGGGDRRRDKDAIRVGFGAFLISLRDQARRAGRQWRVIACGSREAAFDSFSNGIRSLRDLHHFLLVDAEEVVDGKVRAHLTNRDRWDLSAISEEDVHLMAQVMETWFVADPEAVGRYFGKDVQVNALPTAADLELVDKSEIGKALAKASKRTAKAGYQKIRDASRLLAEVDPAKVRSRCRHCNRLFVEVGGALADAE
jgi:Domain of unknown function (DUF4276)